MCITNKRFSEEQENEFIEYTDTTWKTDKEKTDPNDYFFNLLFSENDGLIILFFSPKFSFFYCWKNEGLCKTELVAKINILTKPRADETTEQLKFLTTVEESRKWYKHFESLTTSHTFKYIPTPNIEILGNSSKEIRLFI